MSEVRIAAYLYPWDVLGDPGAATRITNLGADTVVLAAAYHSTRAATPQHPAHRVIDARHAALYVPVRPRTWGSRTLVPEPATEWTGDANSFGLARTALVRAGLVVDAWVVLTHNSILGARHPELTVCNAFGNRYRHALCPANAEVRQYAGLLVQEVLALGQPSGLVVEACGPMGFTHLSHHDKTAGSDWTTVDEQLLSLCFCRGCTSSLVSLGLDIARLAAAARQAVGGGALSVREALGEDAELILAARSAAIAALRDEVIGVAQAAGVMRLAFHASADPWATGPAAAVAVAGARDAAEVYIAGCWGPASSGVAAIQELRTVAGPAATIGAYVSVLPPHPQDSVALADHWSTLLACGADELHIYHAGLASAARLDAAADALRGIVSTRL